ncbi:MAG: response regulator [Niabella sp.]
MKTNETYHNKKEADIVLVIEDDADVNDYICQILEPIFEVSSFYNADSALNAVFEISPDLIISDVMMEGMSGFDLCKALKSDQRTSHIPIILLTALTGAKHQIAGVEGEADVYLTKPFNSELLLAHANNQINIRKKLRTKYIKQIYLEPNNIEIESQDERFITEIIKVIESHIDDTDFHTDELVKAMHMSRSTFYRKLKALTGLSGTEFVRNIRLKYASTLLNKGNYTVNEAAYESGFGDVKYFRKCFQEFFGTNPSDFKKLE